MILQGPESVSFKPTACPALLNIGCGPHFHKDWTNIDIVPLAPGVMACDIRKPLPFPDNSFDVVYHSHVLEHMPKHQAPEFIAECYRVLKPGGIIRVVVPDLESIARLYLDSLARADDGEAGAADRYDWMLLELLDQTVRNERGGEMLRFLQRPQVPAEDFIVERVGRWVKPVIAQMKAHALAPSGARPGLTAEAIGRFRLSGEIHQWMYDRFSLRRILEQARFSNVRVTTAQQSSIPDFSDYRLDIEADGSTRKPDSLFMEAEKPRSDADPLSIGPSHGEATNAVSEPDIVIVNTFENFGGAAQAALRLHRALRTQGGKVTMLVRQKVSDDPSISQVPQPDAAMQASFKARLGARLNPSEKLALRPERGYFSLDVAETGDALSASLPAADLVNLHWVADFLDWSVFFREEHRHAPVVWTLHDMRPFTGGCHYAFDCTGYMGDCGCCPHLGSGDPAGIPHRVLMQQRALLTKWRGYLHIVAPSRWLAGEAARSTLLAGRPVTVIPNSVDTTAFQAIPKAEARTRLGLPAQGRIVLFIAHNVLEPRKGYAFVRQALPTLASVPGATLVTVGNGRPPADSPIPHYHLNGTSNPEMLNMVYAAADVVALPTLQDNLPNTILEAFASGTAVAGFATGGVPDHVLSGATGMLTPPGDAGGLGNVLRSLLEAPEQTAAMGREARLHAEREFAPEVQARRYRALFSEILDKTRQG